MSHADEISELNRQLERLRLETEADYLNSIALSDDKAVMTKEIDRMKEVLAIKAIQVAKLEDQAAANDLRVAAFTEKAAAVAVEVNDLGRGAQVSDAKLEVLSEQVAEKQRLLEKAEGVEAEYTATVARLEEEADRRDATVANLEKSDRVGKKIIEELMATNRESGRGEERYAAREEEERLLLADIDASMRDAEALRDELRVSTIHAESLEKFQTKHETRMSAMARDLDEAQRDRELANLHRPLH